MRAGVRRAAPLLLAGLSLAAVLVIPRIAHAITRIQRPGAYDVVLRAHVAWAHVIALGLALTAAVALARLRREDARAGAWSGTALLLVAVPLAVAASLPAYDAWYDDRLQARYMAAGWTTDGGWIESPEMRAFTTNVELPAHEGPFSVAIPRLEKGDQYMLFASFQGGTPGGYWRSGLGTARHDACDAWEGQTPMGPPDDPTPAGWSTLFLRTCVSREAQANEIVGRWGLDEPVDVRVGALVRPTYANVVGARADESVAVVAGALALFTVAAVATTTPRRAPRGLAEPAALGVGPALACACWLAAALAPRELVLAEDAARAASAAFAILATLAALGVAALVLASWRGRLGASVAVRWIGYVLAALAIFAPVPAARLWPFRVAWVVLGMLATLAVAGLALWASHRLNEEEKDAAWPAA